MKGLDPSCLSASRTVKVDVGYGGAFYAIAVDRDLGIDVCNSSTTEIVRAATLVSGDGLLLSEFILNQITQKAS